jgi:hypothetical protein
MFIKEIKINFNFDFENIAWELYAHNCVSHQKLEQKDIHDKIGGFPKSLCPENTTFYQKFFTEEEIDYKNLEKQLGMQAITISMIKQPPGMTNPIHRDTFYQINKLYPNDKRLKVRANIQLLDWKDGHFLQYNKTVVSHWKKNTGYMWDSEVLHLAVNAGLEDRYSLQVSGFLL